MAEKAQQIINRMREKDRRKRIFARLKDPQQRSITIESINRMDQDETSRVGMDDSEMKILDEMNASQDSENDNWSRGSV